MNEKIIVGPADALIMVDVQNTFCPGGTLPVADGDAVVAPLNRVAPLFGERVWATQDWHPANHVSFAAQGGPWPPHAVEGTPDAALHSGLVVPSHVVRKGSDPARDAYSGFDHTGLADRLREAGIRRVFVGGLATDYCVRATALDALQADFATVVLEDAVRAVNVQPGDGDVALQAMQEAGATLAITDDIII